MTFHDAFYNTPHRLSIKYPHYIDIYERHLKAFQGKAVRVLEIGVATGGFLQVLQAYLGPSALVMGLDTSTGSSAGCGHPVIEGRQDDPAVLSHLPSFDVVIDDASHIPNDQLSTFHALYPHLKSPGVYIVEDTQLSYAPAHGGLKHPGTFMEFVKDKLDDLNAWFAEPGDPQPSTFTKETLSVSTYLNCVVFDKQAADRRSPVWVEV